MTLYVAGPMRGYEMFNFPAFDAAEVRLRHAGFDVVTPAFMDRVNGFEGEGPLPPGFLRTAMSRDLCVICSMVEGIATLDGIEDSRGGAVEMALAQFLRIPVRPVEAWIAMRTQED